MEIRRLLLTQEQNVPSPVAPYSHVVIAGGFLFVTGQMPIDPVDDRFVGGSMTQQTNRVLQNLKNVLESAGSSMDRIVQVRAYLTSFDRYGEFNDAYGQWFKNGLPARTCVGVTSLAVGADVEIDLIAIF